MIPKGSLFPVRMWYATFRILEDVLLSVRDMKKGVSIHILRQSTASGASPIELFISMANVVRIIQRVVPPYCKIVNDSKEIIQHCVSKFIGLITAKANLLCQSESRKMITADDILRAMTTLGFDKYVNALSLYISRYREAESLGMVVSMRRP
ncbi:nuclear transcription factor Y subunit B-6-like [Impatiens glandulifera]|uniref:nuclear transcription factor Y subunit B-6-like n=1 Tax=Impatiens glandulifera TaxID=253017 RepID=UPI001FB08C1B|nr:nuclear transcription factor Y subunit B-6-like [Impatiens glandulifera]